MIIYYSDKLKPTSLLHKIFGINNLNQLKIPNNPFFDLQNICSQNGITLVEEQNYHSICDAEYLWCDLSSPHLHLDYLKLTQNSQKEETNKDFTFNKKLTAMYRNKNFKLHSTEDLSEYLVDLNSDKWSETLKLTHSKSRYFNYLYFKDNRVLKSVSWQNKGECEFFFYQNLPSELKRYFPKIFSHKKTDHEFIYEMELVPAFDFATLYVNKKITTEDFTSCLKQIEQYWSICPKIHVSAEENKERLQELLIDKLISRLETLYYKMPQYLNKRFNLNDSTFSLSELCKILCEKLNKEINNQPSSKLIYSHGDLSISNILWTSEKKIRLVDPRGAMKKNEFYLPQCYDLSKLSHCINGNYDGILNSDNGIKLAEKAIFNNWLSQFNESKNLIYLSEASLFLSLLPLHLDQEHLFEGFVTAAWSAMNRSTVES